MPELYGLLVAIDAYPQWTTSLEGCVNDADAMEQLLTTRFGAKPERLKRLNNQQATRQAVIQTFREHLGQAGKDDVALFFYAGHGSQVPTGDLFKEIEPDRMNESIVCFDSRDPGKFDLVDKDIAVLIGELTSKGVHVTTIFDSCHSGSVTRALARERRAKPRKDAQPRHVYLANQTGHAAAFRDSAKASPGMGSLSRAVTEYAPDQTGLHVLLAACEDNETAKEYIADGEEHGAFSYFLIQTLQRATAPMGYRELNYLVRNALRDCVPEQTPKLECSGGDSMFDNVFLGLEDAVWADYAIAGMGLSDAWQMDRGAMSRVSAGDRFALYPMSATGAELADMARAVAFARAVSVTPASTTLQIEEGAKLDEGLHYKAVVVARAATVPVGFEGDRSGVELLLARAASARSFSVGVAPKFRVVAANGAFTITTGGGDRVLWGPVPQDARGASAVMAALEHMALWKLRVELTNPLTQIPADAVEFVITRNPGTPNAVEMTAPPLRELEMAYAPDASGTLCKPSYKARITNRSPVPLFVALLACSDDWSISTALIGSGTQRLGPGETVFAKAGTPVGCSVPPGATEATDELLMMVSTDLFDALTLRLKPLAPFQPNKRGMDIEEAQDAMPAHDFLTRRITFHTTRNAADV